MKLSRITCLLSLAVLLVSLFGPGAGPAWAGGGGVQFDVNSTADAHDANIGNGICATSGGVCTLRAAIEEANADLAVNTIYFLLPGSGLRTINLTLDRLPSLINQVNLDATSQPFCSVPCVEINGASLSVVESIGLSIETDVSTLKGFAITGFEDFGIRVVGDGNIVQSNYVGLRPGSTTAHPNSIGILIDGSSNIVGGTIAAERNVVSGNTGYGILVGSGTAITGNIIQGNYIGTNAAGTSALGNGSGGIFIYLDATNTSIGTSSSGSGNVISGNGWAGIMVMGNQTKIRRNYIGTKADGTGSLGNFSDGIFIFGATTGNVIGGGTNSLKNKIANNTRAGVFISNDGGGRTTISHNQIYANGQLGIDLRGDGVTQNDFQDMDAGPNWRQNYPAIPSATSSTGVIVANLNTGIGTYTIEFFSSPAGSCDPTNHGEGRTFLGSGMVVTDMNGYARLRFVSPVAFAAGSAITATATDSTGRTSEFSVCRTAQ
jgi:CSLREA domain-containing protein